MKRKFSKMHGAGNDFVVLDGIGQKVALTPALARRIADRHLGVGCDQILLVEQPQAAGADFRGRIRLRVWERGAGETLSCGTGACAAVVAGIRRGLLDPIVAVDTRGGPLTIRWEGAENALNCAVWLTGPAVTVFEGEIQIDKS